MTKPKIGQIYRCRDERHGKRWVRIELIIDIGRPYVWVDVRRGNSRKWIQSQRTINESAFTDSKHQDYKLVRDV